MPLLPNRFVTPSQVFLLLVIFIPFVQSTDDVNIQVLCAILDRQHFLTRAQFVRIFTSTRPLEQFHTAAGEEGKTCFRYSLVIIMIQDLGLLGDEVDGVAA